MQVDCFQRCMVRIGSVQTSKCWRSPIQRWNNMRLLKEKELIWREKSNPSSNYRGSRTTKPVWPNTEFLFNIERHRWLQITTDEEQIHHIRTKHYFLEISALERTVASTATGGLNVSLAGTQPPTYLYSKHTIHIHIKQISSQDIH